MSKSSRMKPEITSPARRQPRRSAKHASITQPPSPKQKPSSGAGTRKRTARGGDKSSKPKRARGTKGAKARAIKELEEKVSAMKPEVALSEQRELLSVPVEPADVPPANMHPAAPELATATPKSAKGKRGRPRKNRAEEDMYMDDFLLSDEEVAHNGREVNLRRADRWIPDMEHRRRISRRPKNVPYAVWMSYCFLDDYIYRNSLTDEEVLSYPLLDDMFSFQSGGTQPATPAGFQWNEKKHLVPRNVEL
ncbi:hypothetical protein F4818DRAFT_416699 [Hypoxylon cercidicola]|nr:hypothetical protein F4818DRAFT_416699 [Hypoxylon cercidicola]